MLARLDALLPFSLWVPEGEQFPIYETTLEGYAIRAYPPFKGDGAATDDEIEQLSVNDTPAFQANVFRIDFHQAEFDRRSGLDSDPSLELIDRVLKSFMLRLRFVTRVSKIKPLDFPHVSWYLQYLNDDESELEEQEGLVRGRGARHHKFSWGVVNKEVWENLHNLPPDYQPPPWVMLLLDADLILPEIGPALVLAATALEVCISQNLDVLAAGGSVPKELWKWMNNRGWLREPSTEEQFDSLFRILCGSSLKDEPDLWEAFKNLKSARNCFVHEGVPRIGGEVVDKAKAVQLIREAREITEFVRARLPEERQWKEYVYTTRVKATMRLFKGQSEGDI